jgi:hypothetical protein
MTKISLLPELARADLVAGDLLPIVDISTGITKRITYASLVAASNGTWTPVVTPTTGTLTAHTATGSYSKVGRIVNFTAIISITTNGTAAGALGMTLPFASAAGFAGAGRENGVNGNMLQVFSASASGSCTIWTYNNLYPGVNGGSLVVSGTYQTAA